MDIRTKISRIIKQSFTQDIDRWYISLKLYKSIDQLKDIWSFSHLPTLIWGKLLVLNKPARFKTKLSSIYMEIV